MVVQLGAQSWSITTSLRSDPQLLNYEESSHPYYMLDYHRDRLLAAADAFGWRVTYQYLEGIPGLNFLQTTLREQTAKLMDHPLKIRVLLDGAGQLNVGLSIMPQVAIDNLFPTSLSEMSRTSKPVWRVFLCQTLTTPSLFTKHKTSSRDAYNAAREHIPAWAKSAANQELEPEILLVNCHRQIMEGSITTPYFFRAGKWLTPPAESGGNLGTTRRYALENRLCVEAEVSCEEVQIGEQIWLSNGVRGWGMGIVEDLSARVETLKQLGSSHDQYWDCCEKTTRVTPSERPFPAAEIVCPLTRARSATS